MVSNPKNISVFIQIMTQVHQLIPYLQQAKELHYTNKKKKKEIIVSERMESSSTSVGSAAQ